MVVVKVADWREMDDEGVDVIITLFPSLFSLVCRDGMGLWGGWVYGGDGFMGGMVARFVYHMKSYSNNLYMKNYITYIFNKTYTIIYIQYVRLAILKYHVL